MNTLDTGYLHLRNEYVIPLSQYFVPLKKVEYWELKTMLERNVEGIKSISAKKFTLDLDREAFYKSMTAEAQLFYTRSLLQYNDYMRTKNIMSAHWRVVTLYYLNFYSVTALFRLLARGFTFFNDDYAKNLSNIVTSISGEMINIARGNYKFSVVKDEIYESFVTVEFSLQDDVHKSTWNYIQDNLIPEMIGKSRNYEEIILKQLLKIGNPSSYNIPSIVRNTINYQSRYGMESINGNLICHDFKNNLDEFITEIIYFDKSDSINSKIKNSIVYGNYFFILMLNLYNEYTIRSKANKDFVRICRSYFHSTHVEMP